MLEDVKTFLKEHKNDSGIIYCRTKKEVDELTEQLKLAKFNVESYHASIGDKKKRETLSQWTACQIKVIVATIAFGMGVDHKSVRYVLLFLH